MLSIIQGIAWIASLALWLALSTFIPVVWNIFLWIIIWCIIKWIFLPEENIQKAFDLLKTEIKKENNLAQEKEIQKEVNVTNKAEIFNPSENIQETTKIEEKTKVLEIEKKQIKQTQTSLEKVAQMSENIQKIEKKEEVWNSLANFFKENLLAKLWALIIFIWVWFLVAVIWNEISNITKLIIWFTVWFCTYFAWVFLGKKNYIWESRVLIWTWILINFLVILAWRHFLKLWLEENISIIATFVALIINTIFWIFNWLHYKSKNLLIFSFIFAYLNPFLLWTSSEDPYILLIYSFLVSIWALIIWEKLKDKYLIMMSFVLWNILFFVATVSGELGFLAKYISTMILCFIFINIKYIKELNFEHNYYVNLIIFLPIILQAFFRNVEISNLWYLVVFGLSFIMFWYLFLQSKIRKKAWFFLSGTIFLIILFLWINKLWDITPHLFISTVILAFLNVISSAFDKNLLEKKNIWFYASSILSSSIFLLWVTILFVFKQLSINEIWKVIWAILIWIWAFYLFCWFIISKIFSLKSFIQSENKNIFVTYFTTFVVYFTVWISLIIWKESPFLMYTVWSLEATSLCLMFYFTNEKKFLLTVNIILTILYFKLIVTLWTDISNTNIYISVILASTIVWAFFIKNVDWEESWNKDYYDWLHIAGIILVYIYFLKINQENKELLILIYSSLTAFLGFFYYILKKIHLKIFFLILFWLNWIFVIQNYDLSKELYPAIISIILFSAVTYFYNFKKDLKIIEINTIYWIFLLVIASMITYNLTKSTFFVTILWWLVWSSFIVVWISRKIILYRTIWLYLITLMSWKILFVDIWIIWDAVIWTIIFIILWIVLIWTSILYTKHIWNDISKEFDLRNIFPFK